MRRQKTLPLDGKQSLDTLWERFPEEGKREVIRFYARLMAAAICDEEAKEEKDE